MSEKEKPEILPQFSVKFGDGFIAKLKEYIPFVDGCYQNPSKNMREAIKNHYPERLQEFDKGRAEKEKHLQKMCDMIKNQK